MQGSVRGLSHRPIHGGPEALGGALELELAGTGLEKPAVYISSQPHIQ